MPNEVHTLILGLYEYAVSHDKGLYRSKNGYRPYSIENNLDYLSGDPLNIPCLWKPKTFPCKSQGNVAECEMGGMRILSHETHEETHEEKRPRTNQQAQDTWALEEN